MENLFDVLTQLALDPFELEAYLAGGSVDNTRPSPDGLRTLVVRAAADSKELAAGDWNACFACSDPGPDYAPEGFLPHPPPPSAASDS
jgi:hypothetical protein